MGEYVGRLPTYESGGNTHRDGEIRKSLLFKSSLDQFLAVGAGALKFILQEKLLDEHAVRSPGELLPDSGPARFLANQ